METLNTKLKTLIQSLMDEVNEVKGMKDTKQSPDNWWKMIDWKEPEMRTVFDSLSDSTRKLIADEGLCPDCPEHQKQVKGASDMTLEGINAKITELQKARQELKDKIDAYYAKNSVPASNPTNKWSQEISKMDEEIEMFYDAKAFKIALGDKKDEAMSCEEMQKGLHPDWTPEECTAECKKQEEVGEIDASKKKPKEVEKELTPEEKAKLEEEIKKLEEERKKKEEENKKLPPKADALDPMKVLERARKIMG